MALPGSHSPPPQIQELLGYLNFSSGASDPLFLANLSALFGEVGSAGPEAWPAVVARLGQELATLSQREKAFGDVEQARAVLRLAGEVLPGHYRQFHRDLLFHWPAGALSQPLFCGRMCEAVLGQGGPWDETERIVAGAIDGLNDFVGHRPVAVLRTAQKMEPYDHEWVRPVPLFVRGAGTSGGPYRELIERALEILRGTDPAILREAYFDPERLDELALDPRAYDFDHPVNKRPNYHFGQWDPHHIDRRGHYRRFVLVQVTLEVIAKRVEERGELPRQEVLEEAAAVLAGTMLMASGTSGDGPDAHDSSVTLSNLLPRIAAYRDAFYQQFVAGVGGAHGERLRREAEVGRQPLAGARQFLNQHLARHRAAQLERVHLAVLFARMGYSEAALRHVRLVNVASARMVCEMQCRLTSGNLAVDAGDVARASGLLAEIEDFLRRAIHCGAVVDPWNILAFQGQFSLFPAPENSVPDHRIEQLIDLVEQTLGLYARAWSRAASQDDAARQAGISEGMDALARWWDQFATTEVSGVESFSGGEAFESAREVASALAAFYQGGAAAGDIAFWRSRVNHFNSPKAYALVVGALCQQGDLVAALGLLMQWLSQAGTIALRHGDYSFHTLAERWLAAVYAARSKTAAERQRLAHKFFELVEVNAEGTGGVPTLELLASPQDSARGNGHAVSDDDELADDEAEEDDTDNLYRAAYDDMVYIDSTGDGVDADMLESGPGPATDWELEHEARRVGERLALVRTTAGLWRQAVLAARVEGEQAWPDEVLQHWLAQAEENQARLLELVQSVSDRRVPAPGSSHDSLVEFDRRRSLKESLLEKAVSTLIETADARRAMRAALVSLPAADALETALRGALAGDAAAVQGAWGRLFEELRERTLLYVPLNRQGDPERLVEARILQQSLRDLLECLPRLGLLKETCQLIEQARLMEASNPVGAGAISEYDRLFAAGYESLVESLAGVSESWGSGEGSDNALVECLEQLTESLLKQWLAHSRTLRLSVLDRIADDKSWQKLKQFVECYGRDLFTQRFLNLGNLRAILHQGVDAWLERFVENPSDGDEPALVTDLGGKLPRAEALKHLSLVIEAIVENHAEYRDYNSTTTQSDQGDMLYTLLDFLRLRVHYDRVAWHLKPVTSAHAVLVRRGRVEAAAMWRDALAERTGELADTLQKRGAELRQKYAMRLPTVTDRLAERFIRPLVIDRVRALVGPAMTAAHSGESRCDAFTLLEQECEELTQEPTGVGLEVPAWLAALEEEVEDRRRGDHSAELSPYRWPVAQRQLSVEEVQQQLTGWELGPH